MPSSSDHDVSHVRSASYTANQAQTGVDDRYRPSIQALFATDPTDDMHMIANKKDKLLDTTDSWILDNPTYSKWLQEDRSHVLWLHGDPGKGKTMLAIALIEEFTRKAQLGWSANNGNLVYFFCDNQDDRRKTAPLILRGLIYQVLSQRSDLAICLHTEYEKQGEQLFTSPNSLHTLWRIFHTIIERSGVQQMFIVIDALDECNNETMEELLMLLEPYIILENDELDQSFQKDPGCNIKWLLTSRNELMIKQLLTGSLDISLEENSAHVDEAVLKFIDIKVNQLTRVKQYNGTLAAVVGDHLREKAEGTFLWVALACRELSKPSVLSINTEETLSRLPPGITPLYTRIMDQILTSGDEKLTSYIKAILQSMIVALRPLMLPELAVAAGLPQQYHHNLQVLAEYVEQCGSMVTIRERQAHFVHLSAKTYLRQAHFVHLSAKTHLLEHGKDSIVSQDLRPEHRNMAIHCFQYICGQLRSDSKPRDSSPSTSSMRKTSGVGIDARDDVMFLEYPMLFWVHHARDASDDIAERFDVNAEFFRVRSKGLQRWFDAYWARTHVESERSPGVFTAMHLAAYAGLSWLLSKLVESGYASDIHSRDSFGNQPLLWAARNGYGEAVSILLAAGAQVAAKNNEGVTALYWAACHGHQSVIQQLLDRGANCRPKDKIGWTPLHRAAFNGHKGVLCVLLDNHADIEAKDGTKWTALMRAATTGNVEVMRLLLARNADTAIKDMEGCTPMHHAALRGNASIVKLLVEEGAEFEERDNEGWTVLQHAAWNGHERMVRYLLKNGSNVHSRADNGWTALHQATWNGHTVVVGRLLKGGADPNEIDDEGEAPLHQAAWRGHYAVVKLLLEADADPNLKDRTGNTALHQAASNGSSTVVQLLLDEGADPRLKDNDDRKPHSLAEENFHHQIAKTLREREIEAYGEKVLPDTDNIPQTSLPDSQVDSAVLVLLSVDPETATIEPYGQAGFSTPSKITVSKEGESQVYFMKTGPDGEMFKGRASFIVCSRIRKLADVSNRRARIVDCHPLGRSFALSEKHSPRKAFRFSRLLPSHRIYRHGGHQ